MEQDFLEDASRERLPIRLIAFDSSELVGTIILREYGSESLPEFQPELGGLYVVESHRGHGIGTELIRAGMKLARDQGYETVFATTVVAAGILERLGWQFIQTVVHSDGPLCINVNYEGSLTRLQRTGSAMCTRCSLDLRTTSRKQFCWLRVDSVKVALFCPPASE